MFTGDITILLRNYTFSVTNLKSCSNGVFKAYIYLYAEQLTPSAPLASQGAITPLISRESQLGVINIPI